MVTHHKTFTPPFPPRERVLFPCSKAHPQQRTSCQGNVSDGLQKRGASRGWASTPVGATPPRPPVWGRRPPRRAVSMQAGTQVSLAGAMPPIRSWYLYRAVRGQDRLPADIWLQEECAMQVPERPPQAGSCVPRGRKAGRRAGQEATLFIASQQTNRVAHKQPKKKRKEHVSAHYWTSRKRHLGWPRGQKLEVRYAEARAASCGPSDS